MTAKEKSIKELMSMPGVGKSIANDLWRIGIKKIDDLKDKDPTALYELSNKTVGVVQDRCLLYNLQMCRIFCFNRKKETKAREIKMVELEG